MLFSFLFSFSRTLSELSTATSMHAPPSENICPSQFLKHRARENKEEAPNLSIIWEDKLKNVSFTGGGGAYPSLLSRPLPKLSPRSFKCEVGHAKALERTRPRARRFWGRGQGESVYELPSVVEKRGALPRLLCCCVIYTATVGFEHSSASAIDALVMAQAITLARATP